VKHFVASFKAAALLASSYVAKPVQIPHSAHWTGFSYHKSCFVGQENISTTDPQIKLDYLHLHKMRTFIAFQLDLPNVNDKPASFVTYLNVDSSHR